MSRQQYRIPLAKPAYLGREEEYVADAVARRELSHGEYVERFEAACAAYLKVKHAVAVSSGTVGLHLAGIVAGWKDEVTEVLTTPLTYVATANAIRYCDALPIFYDVDPVTWTTPELASGKQGDSGLAVDLYGMPCGMEAPVYDACEAFGATTNYGSPLTSHRGGLHVFSFYANKILTTGEGGLVTTDDDDQARQLRLLRGQGQHPTQRYWHEVVGFNGRITNLQGALGLAQVERVDEHLRLRRRIRAHYHARFSAVPEWTWPVPLAGVDPAPWLFAVRGPAGTDPAPIAARLLEVGVETRPIFPCLHMMPAHYTGESFPIAEAISSEGIVLPLYAEMSEDDVDYVCDHFIKAVTR